MQRSTHRILTTHVGSLARPEALMPLLRLKERGPPYDTEAFARLVREAVADVVRKQVEAGIDIVTDGEQGKESFFGYINDHFNGFALQPVPPGQERNPRAAGREYLAFPDTTPGLNASRQALAVAVATARTVSIPVRDPISYKGHAAVQADIATLKTALCGLSHEEVFLPAIAPSYIAATLPNAYYPGFSDTCLQQAYSDISGQYPALHQKSLLHRIFRSNNRTLWSRKSLQKEAKKV